MREIETDTIRACQAGDRGAFRLVVETYSASVLKILRRMTRNPAVADDLAQEAFLRAFLHIRRFNPERAPFSTWLFTIVRNLCRSHLARETARREALRLLEEESGGSRRSQQARILLHREAEALLRSEMEALPADFRLAFLLRVYEQLPYARIADVLGVRTGTAKSRVHRARRLLREALLPYITDGTLAPKREDGEGLEAIS